MGDHQLHTVFPPSPGIHVKPLIKQIMMLFSKTYNLVTIGSPYKEKKKENRIQIKDVVCGTLKFVFSHAKIRFLSQVTMIHCLVICHYKIIHCYLLLLNSIIIANRDFMGCL